MTGARGPLPKPAALRLLEGNPSKRALDLSGGVNPLIKLPPMKKTLRPEGRKIFRRLGPHLIAHGLVSELDEESYHELCQAAGDMAVLDRGFNSQIEKSVADGQDYAEAFMAACISVTPNGYEQLAASYILRERGIKRLRDAQAHFGLSPALRGRVQASNYVQPTLPGIDEAPTVASGFARFSMVPGGQ